MKISVVICTHDPREDYLKRTLAALNGQTLPKDQWELILVDNASRDPLSYRYDITWHGQARHALELELGLTPARLRGIRESKGDLIVFVDDDNVLHSDYLENALILGKTHPFLGAIGGNILPEYEMLPPEWLPPVERVLAIRKANVPRWSNAWDDWQSQPWGAGMILKKEVCNQYLQLIGSDQRRKEMDRKGKSLFSGGDTDMVMGCIDLNLGFGVFPCLSLTHLIPPERMKEDYILRLVRALAASNLWLKHLRGQPWELDTPESWYTHLRRYYHFLKQTKWARSVKRAEILGQQDFQEMLANEKASRPPNSTQLNHT